MNSNYQMFRCVCGKAAYPSKSVAKRFNRHRHSADPLHAYHCDEGLTRVWHLGHQTETREFYREKRKP